MDKPLEFFLHYPAASKASRRVAAGRGGLAERVRAAAEARHLPIDENSDLLQLFARVDFGEVPTLQVLDIVAEVLNWLRDPELPMPEVVPAEPAREGREEELTAERPAADPVEHD